VRIRARRTRHLDPGHRPSSPQRREQQITIEERTGQSFTDPAERHSHRPAQVDRDATPDLGDDMDMGF
jgi:hypothetical protein